MAKIDELKSGSVVLINEDGEPVGVGLVVDFDDDGANIMVSEEEGNETYSFSIEEVERDVVILSEDVFQVLSAMFDGEDEGSEEAGTDTE